MTGQAIYEIIKFWLPLISGFGLVIKAYKSASSGITQWADSLLNNHLSHIQDATEKSASLLQEVRDDHRAAQVEVAGVRSDLKAHEAQALAVQQQILTGIEVLKDRKP